MMVAVMKSDNLLGLRFSHWMGWLHAILGLSLQFGECSQEHGAKAQPYVRPAPSGTLTWLVIQFAERGASFSNIWIMNLWFCVFLWKVFVLSQRWIGLAWYFRKWMTVVISRHAKAQSAKDLRDAARRNSASKQHGSHEQRPAYTTIWYYDTMIYYVNQIR